MCKNDLATICAIPAGKGYKCMQKKDWSDEFIASSWITKRGNAVVNTW